MPFLMLIVRDKYKGIILPKELFGLHCNWKSFWVVFILSTIYVFCRMFITYGSFWMNPNIIVLQVLFDFLIVGFVEELVYRGFGLNILSKFTGAKTATVVQSLFFAAVHIPAYFIHWYCDGTFRFTEMLMQLITAFIWGLIFGEVFRRSNSIWPPVMIHFWYDFSYVLFVG